MNETLRLGVLRFVYRVAQGLPEQQPAPMPMTTHVIRGASSSVTAAGTVSRTTAKHPAAWRSRAALNQLFGLVRGPALYPVSAERRSGLRGESDVAHHRDARLDHRSGPVDRGAGAFEFHRVGAAVLDEALGGPYGRFVGGLIGAERQVGHEQR